MNLFSQLFNKKHQSGGNESTNLQAETINFNGVTISDVRQLALDVYRENALELAGIAKDTALSRAEQVTEKFLKELSEKNPDGLKQSADPDFQHVLFEAQKTFARSGDGNLEEILVNLLVSRAGESEKSFKQVVLNEAIVIASKLTDIHISVLTVIFRLRYTLSQGLFTLQQFQHLLETQVLNFIEKLPDGDTFYKYLDYTGAASVDIGEIGFFSILRASYPGLCSKGVHISEVNKIIADEPRLNGFFIQFPVEGIDIWRCSNSTSNLKEVLTQSNISPEISDRLVALQNSNPMSDEEMLKIFRSNPKVIEFINSWDNSSAKKVSLTPVGIAIAYSNGNKNGALGAPLDIWIK